MRKLALGLLLLVLASGIVYSLHRKNDEEPVRPTNAIPLQSIAAPSSEKILPSPERPAAEVATVWSDGTVLIEIPAGKFLMGSSDGPLDEQPVHEVELSRYAIGKVPVTNRQFQAFVQATGYMTRAELDGKGGVLDDTTLRLKWQKGASWRDPEGNGRAAALDLPVVQVTWKDAEAYAKWAGLRLPTEAEWERAARWDAKANRASTFPWGDGPPSAETGNLPDQSGKDRWSCHELFQFKDGFVTTSPVGSFPKGASPAGVLDMAGNVWQWCEDAYDPLFYRSSPAKDPVCHGFDKDLRHVTRGGSFAPPIKHYRSSRRSPLKEDTPSELNGFRLVSGGGP